MKQDKDIVRALGCGAVVFIYIMVIIVVAMLLTGCTTTKYVPVETIKTETNEVVKWRTDTVIESNDRFVYVKGDTVIMTQTRWRDKIKNVYDTIKIERVDSISVPYPVEKQLSKWERTKVDWGGWAIFALAAVIATLVWLWKRKR